MKTTSNRVSDLTVNDPSISKNGLEALLAPDNCVLLLIDHQAFQFAGLRSHDTQTIINNVVGLAKSAKVFGVPTLFTTCSNARVVTCSSLFRMSFPNRNR